MDLEKNTKRIWTINLDKLRIVLKLNQFHYSCAFGYYHSWFWHLYNFLFHNRPKGISVWNPFVLFLSLGFARIVLCLIWSISAGFLPLYSILVTQTFELHSWGKSPIFVIRICVLILMWRHHCYIELVWLISVGLPAPVFTSCYKNISHMQGRKTISQGLRF